MSAIYFPFVLRFVENGIVRIMDDEFLKILWCTHQTAYMINFVTTVDGFGTFRRF